MEQISLRDYFAAAALPSSIEHCRQVVKSGAGRPSSPEDFMHSCAGMAYEMADAMLEARKT